MVTEASECAGCHRKITDRYLLKAVDQFWHEDCLKCSCCDCRLGEVGSTLFAKANLLLCKRDYLRLFGTTGYCSACQKMIPAFEMVMRAKNNVYHLECFACQQCNHRFCVGDRYFLSNNKILCEFDYEDKMMFPSSSSTTASSACNSGIMSASPQQQLPAPSLQQQQHPTLHPPSHQPPHPHHHHHQHPHQQHHPQQLPAAAQLQQQQRQSPSAAGMPAQTSDDASSGYGSPSPTSIS